MPQTRRRDRKPDDDRARTAPEGCLELDDGQLEHVVGGLDRPAVGAEELDALLDRAGASEAVRHGG